MTTWVILDNPEPSQLVVKYTSDDGQRYVTMPMYWDQVTPLNEWLGRVNPFPTPLATDRSLAPPIVGMTGTSAEPGRTPPLPQEQIAAMAPPRDPLTVV